MRTDVMISIPHIQEPHLPTSDPSISASGTPKSKLRSLFHWRKPSSSSLRPTTRSGTEHYHHAPLSTQHASRPELTSTFSADNAHAILAERPLSADNRLSRRQDRVITDPPPLAQAHVQAILHAQLEAPTSFTEKSTSWRGITTTQSDQLLGEPVEDSIEVKRSHKRTDSGASSCSTQEKLFFLVNGPYVLQYGSDRNGDALPEKILALDRDSVAFACDAVSGRPWVLQISRPQIPTNKSDDRRAVNTLLLVFNDSEELSTWLFAVRKEIENLGGLEYNPDTDDDQTWRENLTRKFAQNTDSQPTSRKSSTARTASTLASPHFPNRTQRPESVPRTYSQSGHSTSSSKKTSCSLDKHRDSVTSDGYSSTLATSFAECSASSTSPTGETFPNIHSVTGHANGDLSLRSYTRGNSTTLNSSKSPSPSRNLLERRKLSVNSLHLVSTDDIRERSRKPLPDLPSTISASPIETPPSTTSPRSEGVSSLTDIKSEDSNQSRINSVIDTADARGRRVSSWKKHSPRKPSIAESGSSIPKAKYSLFPVCPPAEVKEEPLANPSVLTQPSLPRLHTYPQPVPYKPSGGENRHKKSQSRTVTLELRQHRVSALLGAGEIDAPQRSPRVTDEMILSNFGIARNDPPASPMTEIRVPGLSDLKIDLDFLKTPYKAPSKPHSPLSEQVKTTHVRTRSTSRTETSTTLAKTPVGPPPAVPLPAVPTGAPRSARSNRSSQQSHKSQSKGERPGHSVEELQRLESLETQQAPTTTPTYQQVHGNKNRSRSGSRGRRRSTKRN